MSKLDAFLIVVIGFMFAFTITDIILTCCGIYLSTELERCAFTYFLGECGVCGMIKVSADVQKAIMERKNALEDRKYYEDKGDKK